MRILHFEKNVFYNDRELILLARKIGKLATYCQCLKDASSCIRMEAERRSTKKDRDAVKVMVQVDLPHKILRAESRRDTALNALDRCIEKLEPQIKRYKEMRSGLTAVHVARRRFQNRSDAA
jgi:ribosomal subunit interface protein